MLSLVLLAITAPASLSCVLAERAGKVPMTVHLDAAQGVVRYSLPATDRAVTVRALFLPERVMFDRFALDRASLAIVREGDSVTAALGAQPRETRGWCRPVAPAKAGVSRGKRGT